MKGSYRDTTAPGLPGLLQLARAVKLRRSGMCSRCGCCDLSSRECHECGGEGVYEDDDGVNPVELVDCSLCDGKGGWYVCGGYCNSIGAHRGSVAWTESDEEALLARRDP